MDPGSEAGVTKGTRGRQKADTGLYSKAGKHTGYMPARDVCMP